MADDQGSREFRGARVRAGRDAYTAGRDLTVNIHYSGGRNREAGSGKAGQAGFRLEWPYQACQSKRQAQVSVEAPAI